jgi:predicted ribosomally synthesized peptide with SipW-like signal peptide
MKNGKLVATLGAVALVAAVGLGSTLAYLSDSTNTVENTFTLGNVSFGEDPDLGLALVEHEVTLNDTTYTIANDAKWTDHNDYKKVTPGEVLPKDPTVFIGETSEDAWLYVRVSKSADFSDIAWNEDLFTVISEDDNYFYLRKNTVAKAGESYNIFKTVTVDKNMDGMIKDENGNDIACVLRLDDIVIQAAMVQAAGLTDENGNPTTEAQTTALGLFE